MTLSINQQKKLLSRYGKWALVTGATSGIGRGIANGLAASGFNLIITARRLSELNLVKTNIVSNHEVKVDVVAADLSASNDIGKIIGATRDKEIGLVVLNAGFGSSGSFIDSDIETELNMVDVNCKAVLSMAHTFAKRLSVQKRGGIILLGSMVAFQGTPYAANYAATKAYILSLGEALFHELKPWGVDVLTACPGPVSTGFAERAQMDLGNAMNADEIAQQILNALGRKSVSLPGVLTKILVYSLRTVPRWAKVRIMKLVMSGMTKNQIA